MFLFLSLLNNMAKKRKLKAWHMMPLSLIALILVAIFVLFSRGDFSTKDIELKINGPDQVENGQLETFEVAITNNSNKALLDINLFVELPPTLILQNKEEIFKNAISRINSGEEKKIEFSFIASSDKSKEEMTARIDYSPQDVSARFVSVASKEIIIGKLDANMILDLPQTIYAEQEVRGILHIIPNSDIDTSPLYLKLNLPENFKLQDINQNFDYETVWKLGKLKEGDDIKREFIGRLMGGENSYTFSAQLGKLDGVTFLPLNSVESLVEVSESPIFLEQKTQGLKQDNIKEGEHVIIKISYTNKSEIPLEDVKLTTTISRDLIDTSSITAQNARIDEDTGTIEWDKTTDSSLRFVDVNKSGEFFISFNVNNNILPSNVNDTEKSILVETKIKSEKNDLSLGGAVLQADNKLLLNLITNLKLEQDLFKEFSDEGSNPPSIGELSVYTIRWRLDNTMNQARSVRVEAVLPRYALWQDYSAPSNENIEFISSTNTVVWNVDNVDVGTGNIYPRRTAEFKIGIVAESQDIASGLKILEQTKLTGVDSFTNAFLEQDIGVLDLTN